MLDTAVSVFAVQAKWIRYIYIYLCFLISFPLRSRQSTSRVPWAMSRFSLVTRHIHSSVCMSAHSPDSSSPFPAWSMFVLYVCVSLCYAVEIICTIFLDLLLILILLYLCCFSLWFSYFFLCSSFRFETILPLLSVSKPYSVMLTLLLSLWMITLCY